jgi:hypothetical protein
MGMAPVVSRATSEKAGPRVQRRVTDLFVRDRELRMASLTSLLARLSRVDVLLIDDWVMAPHREMIRTFGKNATSYLWGWFYHGWGQRRQLAAVP